jgi:DNA polymerase III alpha subunit (gram-positive type)
MTTVWVDTETTGLDPANSGAFEIAIMIYNGPEKVVEQVFNLNPLNETILFGEEAAKVNGIPENVIRSYPAAEEVIPKIINLLDKHIDHINGYYFAGYNCEFDYKHIAALFKRCGYVMGDYFNGKFVDVFELVKKAIDRGLIKRTENKKLETMCKALHVELSEAHTASADIQATRKLYETIYMIERKMYEN